MGASKESNPGSARTRRSGSGSRRVHEREDPRGDKEPSRDLSLRKRAKIERKSTLKVTKLGGCEWGPVPGVFSHSRGVG